MVATGLGPMGHWPQVGPKCLTAPDDPINCPKKHQPGHSMPLKPFKLSLWPIPYWPMPYVLYMTQSYAMT